MVILKGSYWYGKVKKKCCLSRCRNICYQCDAANYPVSWMTVEDRECKYENLRAYQSSWYRVCTKAMFISVGSNRYGELKNVLHLSVQKEYLQVRGRKLPGFMGGSIEPRMEICECSGLPITIVSRLHQSNGYTKMKLRVLRGQKCFALFGAEIVLNSAGLQTTPFHG